MPGKAGATPTALGPAIWKAVYSHCNVIVAAWHRYNVLTSVKMAEDENHRYSQGQRGKNKSGRNGHRDLKAGTRVENRSREVPEYVAPLAGDLIAFSRTRRYSLYGWKPKVGTQSWSWLLRQVAAGGFRWLSWVSTSNT